MLNKISKFLLYLAIFVLPLFVLPLTTAPLMWNKHILLLVITSVVLILWLINIMKTGELRLNWTKLSTAMVVLLAVLGLSTAFSSSQAHSFWSALNDDSYLNFILYAVIFFLVSNIFDKSRDFIKILVLLLISDTIVNILFLSQLFFGAILPWDFTHTAGFNLISTIWGMAVFFGGLTVVLISFLGNSSLFKNKLYQALGYLALVLFFVSLIVIDLKVVWIGIALAMIMVIWQKMKEFSSGKNDSEAKKVDLRQVYLPAVIFVIAVILIVIIIPLPKRFILPGLISLNNQSSYQIIGSSFGDSVKNMIIGSGPATWEYQYVRHQPVNIVQGPYWQTRFPQGSFALTTWALEFGVVGLMAFLLILLAFSYRGLKMLISTKKPDQSANRTFVQSVLTVLGLYYLLFWFLYSADFFLLFITFFIFGLWLAASNTKRKQIVFIKAPQQAFFIMLLSIILIAGSVIGLYYSGKKYVAAMSYEQALATASVKNSDINSVVGLITKATDLDSTNDLYWRELSEVYLIKLEQILADQALTPAQKEQNLQPVFSQLEALTEKLLEVSPANSQNQEQVAKIYVNFMAMDAGAYQLAIDNYKKVGEINPNNPSIPYNIASLNFELAKNAKIQAGQAGTKSADKTQLQSMYDENIKSALENVDAALKLKNNYTQAYYLKAMIYEFSGQNDLAVANYQIVLQLEPNNQAISDKIKALQAFVK